MTEQEWLDIFADNLVDMIKEARMTQQELADEAGLSRASISSYIHKRRIPTVKALVNIAYALDCDFNDFIDFGDKIY